MIKEYSLNVCFLLTFFFVFVKCMIRRPLSAALPLSVKFRAGGVLLGVLIVLILYFGIAFDWSTEQLERADRRAAMMVLAPALGGMAIGRPYGDRACLRGIT